MLRYAYYGGQHNTYVVEGQLIIHVQQMARVVWLRCLS
jgi:hypothetical protein